MSDLALILGGAVSCFAFGWAIGRWVKTLRQFFDNLS